MSEADVFNAAARELVKYLEGFKALAGRERLRIANVRLMGAQPTGAEERFAAAYDALTHNDNALTSADATTPATSKEFFARKQDNAGREASID